MFPTADHIALAVVTASRVHGENPAMIVRGTLPVSRARHVAYDALRRAFEEANRKGLSRCLGYHNWKSAGGCLANARRQQWWSDDAVDEIVGALLEESAQDGGAPDAVAPEAPFPSTPVPPAALNFDRDERRIISRMWNGGADAVSIGAAIGSDADTIRAFARANPLICPSRTGRP